MKSISKLRSIEEIERIDSAFTLKQCKKLILDYEYFRELNSNDYNDGLEKEESFDLGKYSSIMFRVLEYLATEKTILGFIGVASNKGLYKYIDFEEIESFTNFNSSLEVLKNKINDPSKDPMVCLLSWANSHKEKLKNGCQVPSIYLIGRFLKELVIKYLGPQILQQDGVRFENKNAKDFIMENNINLKTLMSKEEVKDPKVQVNIDSVFGYVLSHFLSSPVNILRDTYKHDDKNPGLINYYCQLDESSNIFFNGKSRTYDIFCIKKSWYIAYKRNPSMLMEVHISELLQPLLCQCCKKVINEDPFISNCKYHHKYHKECIKDFLLNKCGKISELIEGIEDYKKPRPICYACGSLLGLRKLVEIFQKAFETEYLKNYEGEKTLKFASDKDIKNFLLKDLENDSPFQVEKNEDEKKVMEFQFALTSNVECKISEKEFIKFAKQPSSIWYSKFCAQCGKNCINDKLFMLSCGHISCYKCTLPWFSFCDTNNENFRKYIENYDSKIIILPICICRHCKIKCDIASLQIHNDHYIPLTQLLRESINNRDNAEYYAKYQCTEEGRTVQENIKNIIKEIFDPSKPSSLIIEKDLKEEIKATNNIKRYISHRYCYISDDGKKLIGCRCTINDAELDLTAKPIPKDDKDHKGNKKGIIEIIEEYEEEFVELMKIPINWSEIAKNLKGCEILSCKEFNNLVKDDYIDMKIYSQLYNYSFKLGSSPKLYFTPIDPNIDEIGKLLIPTNSKSDPMNDKVRLWNFGPNEICSIKKNIVTSGAFGHGIYLSSDISIAHRITVEKDCSRYIVAVYVAMPTKKHNAKKIYFNDSRRYTGDFQDMETENIKDKKYLSGEMQGNILTINREKVEEMVVVFDPVLITPVAIVSYGINFTKL